MFKQCISINNFLKIYFCTKINCCCKAPLDSNESVAIKVNVIIIIIIIIITKIFKPRANKWQITVFPKQTMVLSP